MAKVFPYPNNQYVMATGSTSAIVATSSPNTATASATTATSVNNSPNVSATGVIVIRPAPLLFSQNHVTATNNPKLTQEQLLELQNLIDRKKTLSESNFNSHLSALQKIHRLEGDPYLNNRAAIPTLHSIEAIFLENYLYVRQELLRFQKIQSQCTNLDSVKQHLKLDKEVSHFSPTHFETFHIDLEISRLAAFDQIKKYETISKKMQERGEAIRLQAAFTDDSDTFHKKNLADIDKELEVMRLDDMAEKGIDVMNAPPAQIDTFDNTVIFLQAHYSKGCCAVM